MQVIKNIWWQLKANTWGKLFWKVITIENIPEDVLIWLAQESMRTGECVEQIIQGAIVNYVKINR
jgi:hypothetical protein